MTTAAAVEVNARSIRRIALSHKLSRWDVRFSP